jgi:hypothetical protein
VRQFLPVSLHLSIHGRRRDRFHHATLPEANSPDYEMLDRTFTFELLFFRDVSHQLDDDPPAALGRFKQLAMDLAKSSRIILSIWRPLLQPKGI